MESVVPIEALDVVVCIRKDRGPDMPYATSTSPRIRKMEKTGTVQEFQMWRIAHLDEQKM